MPTIAEVDISKLSLDLKNYRTTPQKNEYDAVNAMISINEDRFFAVMDSILDKGFLFIENIIVLKKGNVLTVKEGNRRIAILKIIHGLLDKKKFNIIDERLKKISLLNKQWLKDNLKVPCISYELNEIDKVDDLVSLTHGKGEKASREPWTSVARARHNRDAKQAIEPSLDLLEKYLINGKNLSIQQQERWAGDYPISVLDEALRELSIRLGFSKVIDLVQKYPSISKIKELNNVLFDIGLNNIGFPSMRNVNTDLFSQYGIPPIISNTTSTHNTASTDQPSNTTSSNTTTTSQPATNTSNTASTASSNANQPKAYAINDPKRVKDILKKFNPHGHDRDKVVTLRDEMKKLKIQDNPLAFCFLLRSMFEISAKAYCKDHSIPTKVGDNSRKLIEILKDIKKHIIGLNPAKKQILHGAITELSKPEGILSVRSMNQLVHNVSFSVIPGDICTLFGSVYPLLEEMN